jgi:ATP-dependent DNA helicase RecQ
MKARAEALLRASVGNPEATFHDGQWESIEALVGGRKKLLVVQKTGWGKSSVYFISTRLLRDMGAGPTIIISPLLALMRNQIEAAGRLGVRAATINSSLPQEQCERVARQAAAGELDALIISPEKLANDEFNEKVLMPIAGSVGLFVVDEAHCISDWGHDFRPDYRRIIGILRRLPPNVPVLATTATANNRVIADIQTQLGNQLEIQRGPLTRESLQLQNIVLPSQTARLAWLAENIQSMHGSGIIYATTIRDVENVTAWLKLKGINVEAYYGTLRGMTKEESSQRRLELEDMLLNDKVKALVSTSALGMGYDKPNLGFVVHFQSPGSVVNYYQQVGRAGRAIEHAHGVLLTGREDAEIQQYFINQAFPKEFVVNNILQALEAAPVGLKEWEIEKVVNVRPSKIEQALKFLRVESPAPVMKDNGSWVRTPVAYQMPHERIERLSSLRAAEWQEMQRYQQLDTCLMQFLAHALDDPIAEPCGKCAICMPQNALPTTASHQNAVDAATALRRTEIELPAKKRVAPSNAQTAEMFPQYELPRMLNRLQNQTGRILSRWGDAGWGHLVTEGKHQNQFADELVDAVIELITQRWCPQPAPGWITCVPSSGHPELVPNFARRVANKLGIPFIPAVFSARAKDPQKNMENSFFRCRNLDGAFSITQSIPSTPVLLIDDAVDSGWTFAVVGALLRKCGSGPVYPLALATTENTH